MKREPTEYSRPLVVLGLGVVLVGDVVVGLPSAAFVGAGATVLLVAAAVHLVGDEPRAAVGWVMFALALAFFGFVEVGSSGIGLLAVGSLLTAGLALQLSERIENRD